MNLNDWRKTNALVSWFTTLKVDPNWKLVISVLDDSHPRLDNVTHGLSETDCVRKLGVIEGFDIAVSMLKSMSRPLNEEVQVESTFSEPESSKEEG